jgi:transaldolase
MTIATPAIEQAIFAGVPVNVTLLFSPQQYVAAADADILGEFEKAGVDVGALAERLQAEGAEAFVQSWRELLQAIDTKSTTLRRHAAATAKR